MGIIKGTAVTLYDKVQTGTDEFNAPVWEETPVIVENVLITPEDKESDIVQDLQLYGKRAEYVLSIPKTDDHDWTDKKVEFWGQMFRTFGFSREYIEDLVPLSWNRKVKVERYG